MIANPALNESSLTKEIGRPLPPPTPAGTRDSPPPPLPVDRTKMTVGGTCTATIVLLLFTLLGGAFGWSQVETVERTVRTATGVTTVTEADFPSWLLLGVLAAFGISIAIAFRPKLARNLGVVYGLLYGAAIGGISAVYESQWEGIVPQAVMATISVFVVMLVLYATGTIRVTNRLRIVIIAATAGIFVMYLATFVLSIFGVDLYFWNEPSPLGIGISVIIVCVAAFNLLLDFDFVDRAVAAGAPKHVEWYAAFGLTITIIWLYLEMLRLLALLQGRN